MTAPAFRQLLTTLCRNNVEFIVVGGVAAVLQGAPVTTFDLDALIRVDSENAESILAALSELEAHMREHDSRLRPDKSDLLAGGHLLLMTNAGPLDLLGFVGDNERYQDLIQVTTEVDLEGNSLRVLELDTLIRLKRQLGRPKDLASLALLEAVAKRR